MEETRGISDEKLEGTTIVVPSSFSSDIPLVSLKIHILFSQLGGIFIISQRKGFLYQHRDNYAGDHPDLDKILEICEKFLTENPSLNWSNKTPLQKEWEEVVQ